MNKVALTGRACTGKDWLFGQSGVQCTALSEPIVGIILRNFPTLTKKCIKASPGGRRLMKQIGQWCRGYISDEYPLSAERMLFIKQYRHERHASADLAALETDQFFLSQLLLLKPEHTYVTGVRFINEIVTLKKWGYTIFHVQTDKQSLVEQGGSREDLFDYSEQLNIDLDASFLGDRSKLPAGIEPKAVWVSNHCAAPNDNFLTVDLFKQLIEQA